MTLAEIRDWLKIFNVAENYYIGRLDNKREKSLGVYNLARRGTPVMALGGASCSSYDVKSVSLLLHWNKNARETEEAAQRLWKCLLNRTDDGPAVTDDANGNVTLSSVEMSADWHAVDDGSGNISLRADDNTPAGTHIQYIQPNVPEPIAIGTDENGVYEYVIEINIYFRR